MKSKVKMFNLSFSHNAIAMALLLSASASMACPFGGDGGDPQQCLGNTLQTSVVNDTAREPGKGGDGSDPRGSNGNPSRGGGDAGPGNR